MSDGFLLTPIIMSFPFCQSRKIPSFFCEAPALRKLSCADISLYRTFVYVCCVLMLFVPIVVISSSYTPILCVINISIYETLMYLCCVLMLLIPVTIISGSYGFILLTIHRMNSAEDRRKAFATCSSHMTVVTLFYWAAVFTYMLPSSYHTLEKDMVVSVFYTILTPVLNPLIYSLINKALKKMLRVGPVFQETIKFSNHDVPSHIYPCWRTCFIELGLTILWSLNTEYYQIHRSKLIDIHKKISNEELGTALGVKPSFQEMTNSTMLAEFLLSGFADVSELRFLLTLLFLLMYLATLLGTLLIVTATTLDQNLHTPMYFFLRNLSILDMCYISVTVPKACVNSLTDNRAISVAGCAALNFLVLYCIYVQLRLLTIMARDCYVAICQSLHYPFIMNYFFCVQMTLASHSVVSPMQLCTPITQYGCPSVSPMW
ncbi:Olfactory Receptor 2T29 [Manis pentadactyla]|nr:Olfactory Receptor 2T29 [Manis pentadactyla]